MKINNNKFKKLLTILLVIILIVSAMLAFCYFNYFYPKTETKSIDSKITLSTSDIGLKFFPKDFKFSLNEISVESKAKFTEDELTDIFIMTIQEIPEAKEYITGLKVEISKEHIILYLHGVYKGIPVEGNFTFTPYGEGEKGIFHYERGKVGLIDIPKDIIFKQLEDNLFFQFNKDKGDIVLSFPALNQLQVTKVETKDKSIEIDFKGILTLKK